ncbi:MAG: hypothetical protein ACI3XG_03865 [Faecousia sp.]
MKRIPTLLMLLALLCAMAVPALADDNNHQVAQVLEITAGVEEGKVPKTDHLQDEQMMQVLQEFRDTEGAEEILPGDMEIKHLTMIRQRDVANNGEPIALSLRAWGACNRYLVVLFRPAEEETWTVVAAAQGEFIDAVLPGDGQYALAWSWG